MSNGGAISVPQKLRSAGRFTRYLASVAPMRLAMSLGLAASGAVAAALVVQLTGSVVAQISLGDGPVLAVLLLAGLVGAQQICVDVAGYLGREVGRSTIVALRDDLFQQVASVTDLERMDHPDFQDRLQAARMAVDMASRSFPVSLGTMLYSLLGVVSVLVVLLRSGAWLAWVMLAIMVPLWSSERMLSRHRTAALSRGAGPDRARAVLEEQIRRPEVIREGWVYQGWDLLRSRYRQVNTEVVDIEREVDRTSLGIRTAGTVTVTVALGGSFVAMFAALGTAGSLGAGSAARTVAGALAIAGLARGVVTQYGGLLDAGGQWAIMEAALADKDHPGAVVDAVDDSVTAVRFEHVWFRYRDSPDWVLRDVSFALDAGEVLSVVGANGAGKTTLAGLAGGLLNPTSGRVVWNETDVAVVPLEQRWRHVALVQQTFGQYELSFRENIVLGREAGEAAVDAAVDATDLRATIADSERGLDQPLGRRLWGEEGQGSVGGMELSGGQWKRLALARGLLERRSILIADEPSAALDPRAERDILAALRNAASGAVGLFVSHRLTSIEPTDHVLLLSDGEVAAQGFHADLWANSKVYREFFRGQVEAMARATG